MKFGDIKSNIPSELEAKLGKERDFMFSACNHKEFLAVSMKSPGALIYSPHP